VCLLVTSLLGPGLARADVESDAGFWWMGFAQGGLEELGPGFTRLRWWLDLQLRFTDETDGFQQGVVRPGLGYALTDHTSLWGGYAWIRTSPPRGSDTDEHRIWQQFWWSRQLASVSTQLRTRLEQRFLSTGDDVGWRFRQFAKLGRPFGFEPRLSLVGYDEIFFKLNGTDWGASGGFDRNRFFVGLAWRFDRGGRVVGELGYLNQYARNRGRSDDVSHLLMLNLLLNR
jgi:hypothetical protein